MTLRHHVDVKTSSAIPGTIWQTVQRCIIRCKNLAIYIGDCESLCLSDETLTAVGPFYLVAVPGEVKYPTQGVYQGGAVAE